MPELYRQSQPRGEHWIRWNLPIHIQLYAVGPPSPTATIEFNAVYNTMKTDSDGGGIYLQDQPHLSTGMLVNNNVVGNHDSSTNSNSGKGIYLDDYVSYTTITSNVVYGHGTRHRCFGRTAATTSQPKIIFLTSLILPELGLYQSSATPCRLRCNRL